MSILSVIFLQPDHSLLLFFKGFDEDGDLQYTLTCGGTKIIVDNVASIQQADISDIIPKTPNRDFSARLILKLIRSIGSRTHIDVCIADDRATIDTAFNVAIPKTDEGIDRLVSAMLALIDKRIAIAALRTELAKSSATLEEEVAALSAESAIFTRDFGKAS